MIELLTAVPSQIRQFRANVWNFQATLVTPRNAMKRFLAVVLGTFPVLEGSITTNQVVFEPDHVVELLNPRGIFHENLWEFTMNATGVEDVTALLDATLNDWIDFTFVPTPASFAIYADHDEYLIVFGSQATAYVIRVRQHMWGLRPSLILVLSSLADVLIISMMAIRGIAMTPLAIWVVVCEFAAAIVFGLVLDVVKIPIFARLRIS